MNRKRFTAKFEAMLERDRDEFRRAPVVGSFSEFRDEFSRSHARASVELCHGEWTTFCRMYYFQENASFRAHGSREEARNFAREWLRGLA